MNTLQKANVTIFFDDQNEPCGMIFFNKNRERVIYLIEKADEEEIIGLFEGKNCTSKKARSVEHANLTDIDAKMMLPTKNTFSK